MVTRRLLLLALPFSAFVAACRKDAPAESAPLAASDSVDPAFQGCARSCGSQKARDRKEARSQPGASVGDAVFCPVSGAVFRIAEETPRRITRGRLLFFCCESCASYFTQHEGDVLAKRGLAS